MLARIWCHLRSTTLPKPFKFEEAPSDNSTYVQNVAVTYTYSIWVKKRVKRLQSSFYALAKTNVAVAHAKFCTV